ncbi:MAG: chorismate mutase [Clostridiales Family XIII bacterium]|jgi:chorismate mutase/prephenate dehydratase|nr:chorismate mutase [Clostridiales Family XIII bacterium]
MDAKEELTELRRQIDGIDEGMIALFQSRMEISRRVAGIKRENNMAILDAERERQVVERAAASAEESLRGEASLLMRSIMALSRKYQREILFHGETPLLPPPAKPVEEDIVCAFQGAPGAWGEQAAARLLPDADLRPEEFFEDVFKAVKEKRARYGVVAIENSQTGAIGETYDLLRKYGCFIVKRIWIDIRHCLLAPAETALADIREVFSHPQGFRQCGGFLRKYAWELKACRNTAVAAKTAAGLKSGKTAAIGSRRAAEINGLQVLVPDIMDSAANRTSFVMIATEPEYDEGSDLISVTFSTAHRSGALCETLLPFMARDINLTRIESRPASPGQYRFFAELQGNILDEGIVSTLRQAAASCAYFEVIGCYCCPGGTHDMIVE